MAALGAHLICKCTCMLCVVLVEVAARMVYDLVYPASVVAVGTFAWLHMEDGRSSCDQPEWTALACPRQCTAA